jgi:hypothetical protein
MFRITVIAALALTLLAGCEAPSGPPSEVSSVALAIVDTRDEEPRYEGEFPRAVTLEEFREPWFPSKVAVAIVEGAEEGDGYRALGIDVESGRVVYQVVGPREQYPEVMQRIAANGLIAPGCGVGQGVLPLPGVPPVTCGSLRCQPGDYVLRGQRIAEMSCPGRP